MSKQYAADDGFLITNPEKQPGVTLNLPSGVAAIGLREEGYYADTMVRCSFCRQRQRHRRGYFAVLPDGSLALCGHCCAVELTSKSTVAEIDRKTDRRIAAAKQRAVSSAVTKDLKQILEHVDRDFLPLERKVNETLSEFGAAFPGVMRRSRRPSIGLAKGGLVGALKQAEQTLTPAFVEKLLVRRKQIFDALREGLDALEEGVALLHLDRIRSNYRDWARREGYEEAKLEDRTLTVGKWETYLDEYDFWYYDLEIPDVSMPDRSALLKLLS